MPMVPLYTYFPGLAVDETRTVTVQGRDDLPDGEYGFLELYCDEIDCDCRRVMINVVSPTSKGKIWATINYGWESLGFYESWLKTKEDAVECKGPSLDPLNRQTEYSPVFLQLFELILKDERYFNRLKRHYELFKSAIPKTYQGATKKPGKRKRWRLK